MTSANFEDLIGRSNTAGKPAAGIAGRLWYDTTLEKLQRDNGSTWEDVEPAGLTNPMSAAGDLIIGGASGTPTRLAKGTDTNILTMVSGSPAWAAAPASVHDRTMVSLYDNTISTPGSWDQASLDQTYDALEILITSFRSSASADIDNAKIYFNNDTTDAHYTCEYIIANGAGPTRYGTTVPYLGDMAGGTSPANAVGFTKIVIPDYTGSTLKYVSFENHFRRNASNLYVEYGTIEWASTAAINRIKIAASSNFAAGARVRIYGIKDV